MRERVTPMAWVLFPSLKIRAPIFKVLNNSFSNLHRILCPQEISREAQRKTQVSIRTNRTLTWRKNIQIMRNISNLKDHLKLNIKRISSSLLTLRMVKFISQWNLNQKTKIVAPVTNCFQTWTSKIVKLLNAQYFRSSNRDTIYRMPSLDSSSLSGWRNF